MITNKDRKQRWCLVEKKEHFQKNKTKNVMKEINVKINKIIVSVDLKQTYKKYS